MIDRFFTFIFTYELLFDNLSLSLSYLLITLDYKHCHYLAIDILSLVEMTFRFYLIIDPDDCRFCPSPHDLSDRPYSILYRFRNK